MPKLALRAQIPPRAGLFFRFAKLYEQETFEDPCSPDSSGQRIFDRKEVFHFQIRSLSRFNERLKGILVWATAR